MILTSMTTVASVMMVMRMTVSDDFPRLGESVVVVRGLGGVMGAMLLVITHGGCR